MNILKITALPILASLFMVGPAAAFSDESLEQVLQLVNVDGNNSLNAKEFQQFSLMMAALGGDQKGLMNSASPEDLKNAFALIDTNADGQVSVDELKNSK